MTAQTKVDNCIAMLQRVIELKEIQKSTGKGTKKLTQEQIDEIIKRHSNGESAVKIAVSLGIHEDTVHRHIRQNKKTPLTTPIVKRAHKK